ncbi:MAG: CDP-alcohol phosphatidyltransferase family protein [Thermoleophilia bacterium]|nr:CDP-alcohol phosphatidyltransferase family protein [Thermoleophilia bacterium]
MANGALARIQGAYIGGVRRAAATAMGRLGRSRVTPNALTAAGVLLSVGGAVLVPFEQRGWGFYWAGATLFVVGSILDILDGALARSLGSGSPFGGFIDSTVDRVGEAAMLGAIGLVFMRHELEWALALTFAAVAGSFLVSYVRARAEILALRGDVGIGSRAERVVVITAGLVLAPLHELVLAAAIALLTLTAWVTVVQRILAVRTQLRGSS